MATISAAQFFIGGTALVRYPFHEFSVLNMHTPQEMERASINHKVVLLSGKLWPHLSLSPRERQLLGVNRIPVPRVATQGTLRIPSRFSSSSTLNAYTSMVNN